MTRSPVHTKKDRFMDMSENEAIHGSGRTIPPDITVTRQLVGTWIRTNGIWSLNATQVKIHNKHFYILGLEQNGRNDADGILKYTSFNKTFEFRMETHWNMFRRI